MDRYHHHERHVMAPGVEAAQRIVGLPPGILGVLERPLDEVPGRLHVCQLAQTGLGLSPCLTRQ